MPAHLLHMAYVVLSVSVDHLSKHEVVIHELTLANRSSREQQLTLSMHLEIAVYHSFVGPTVLVDYLAGSDR